MTASPTAADSATCEHADLDQGAVYVAHDLAEVFVDYRCRDCGDKLTEVFQHSQWLDGFSVPTDAPAFAEER